MIEVQFNKHFHWEYDHHLSRKKAEALYRFNNQLFKETKSYAGVYACPGRPDLFIMVSNSVPGTAQDFGKRFLLIRKTPKGLILLDQSRGMMDSYILQPTFFTSKDRVIILGDTGAEYSWGVVAYEIRKDKLKYLGTLNVAKPAEDNTINPIPDALVKSSKGRLRVEFHTDLYFNTGMSKDGLVKRVKGRPFVFEHDGKEFQLKKGKQ